MAELFNRLISDAQSATVFGNGALLIADVSTPMTGQRARRTIGATS